MNPLLKSALLWVAAVALGACGESVAELPAPRLDQQTAAPDQTPLRQPDPDTSGQPAKPVVRPTPEPSIALVWRGPGTCGECTDALVALLKSSQWNFDVRFVGPDEGMMPTDEVLATAKLYVQPDGNRAPSAAYASVSPYQLAIRRFVQNGGRYLGVGLGGYLSAQFGFNMVPGLTGQYIGMAGSQTSSPEETMITVQWHDGRTRQVYFQDGNWVLYSNLTGVKVLGRYTNSTVAVGVSPFGLGKVGFSGPSLEAREWMPDPDGTDLAFGREWIDAVME